MRRPVLVSLSAVAAAVLAASAVPAAASDGRFSTLASYQVSGEVAEIVAATPDGRTLLYTDSAAQQVGFVDLTHPAAPRGAGELSVPGEPTSVAITPDGRYALIAVNTSPSFVEPSGQLLVVRLRDRAVVRTLDLGGQPDSVAVGADGRLAAVAVENERDEDVIVDGVEGGLPQAPAGYLASIRLAGPPHAWRVRTIALTGLRRAGFPSDPEPEYVDIRGHVAAVTLQENNAVALVDLRSRRVLRSFSAGDVVRDDADLMDDDAIAFTQELSAPREPDTIQWTEDGNLLTADEGDLAEEPSGGRGWTVFTPGGDIVFTSGGSAEQALAARGFYPDDRSDDKGAEFEGAEVAAFGGVQHAFVASERGDAVLVYRFEDESTPTLLQVLPTGEAPEGLLAVPSRGLFVTSNEDDGTITIFGLHG